MATEELPLRERKKQRTRRELICASERLFAANGFDSTTLEQICEAVEISVPTLLAYFPSKDRLAMAREWATFELLRDELLANDRERDAMTTWRHRAAQSAAWVTEHKTPYIRALGIVRASDTLRRAQLEVLAAYEDALTEALARDFGTDPRTDLTTMMLATTLVFGNHRVLNRWADSDGGFDLDQAWQYVADFASSHLPDPGTVTLDGFAR